VLQRSTLSLVLLWLFAAPTAAQLGHPPTTPQSRPLHARLDAADAAVLVVVGATSEGRIAVRRETTIFGEVPDAFEVKRSPLRPPPLAEGDRAILLLQGARPPYVLVDAPDETIRLVGGPMADRWREAVSVAWRNRGEPEALARTYLGWIDEGPPTLRNLGAASLTALLAGSEPAQLELHHAVALERAPVVARMELPLEARRVAAALAATDPEGAALAASALVEAGALDDAVVVEVVLRGAAFAGAPAGSRLFEAALASPDPEVRSAALRQLAPLAASLGEEPIAIARRVQASDPEPGIRRAAEKAVRNAERRRERGAP
jgi:hypothetical protein